MIQYESSFVFYTTCTTTCSLDDLYIFLAIILSYIVYSLVHGFEFLMYFLILFSCRLLEKRTYYIF